MRGFASWVGLAFLGLVAAAPCRAQVDHLSAPAFGQPTASITPQSAGSSPERVGLALPQPYVRGKIPVVFIHGLWMNTSAWTKMIASFRSDPSLDDRFQFWSFGYSTGDPIPYAALLLRRELQAVRLKFDPDRADPAFDWMVLVGHSMGGLLAKMMVVDPGDHLWDVISPRRAEEMRGDQADIDALTQALIFAPHPGVRRVIFIATPHGGSQVDSGSIHQIGNRFVRINDQLIGVHARLARRNGPSFFRKYFYDGLPTSVQELKVNGPLLTGLHRLPIAPPVRAHSIIAVRPNSPANAPTDGLVTLESARIGGVVSEKVVNCPHLLCLEDPEVTGEVRRILHEHEAAR